MSDATEQHHPTEIKLHTKSRILSITFEDGVQFDLPCEYLRVFSPAAELRGRHAEISGKQQVNIIEIEPQGQYAVRIRFDDGHDTGIYAWGTLYRLGRDYARNWSDYLEQAERLGIRRDTSDPGSKRLRLLYFAWLAKKLRRDTEDVQAPASVEDVAALLTWLGGRKRGAAVLFEPERVRVTVNRVFSEPFTRLEDGDEIGIVPTSPNPPPTPDLI